MRMKQILLAVALSVVFAAPVSAIPVFYGEVWTATQHKELTTETPPTSWKTLLESPDANDLGPGFGAAGYVVAGGPPLKLTLTFAPDGYVVDAITSARVRVLVKDDQRFDEQESGELLVDGQALGSGPIQLVNFGGNVIGLIKNVGDSVELWFAATQGDATVEMAKLRTQFDGRPIAAHTPEPAAALLFAAGLLIATRHRLSA